MDPSHGKSIKVRETSRQQDTNLQRNSSKRRDNTPQNQKTRHFSPESRARLQRFAIGELQCHDEGIASSGFHQKPRRTNPRGKEANLGAASSRNGFDQRGIAEGRTLTGVGVYGSEGGEGDERPSSPSETTASVVALGFLQVWALK